MPKNMTMTESETIRSNASVLIIVLFDSDNRSIDKVAFSVAFPGMQEALPSSLVCNSAE
jgi:hypothetical protein